MATTIGRSIQAAAPANSNISREIAAFQENLESRMSFVYAHPGGVLDFRPMADSIRHYLASDEAKNEDYRAGVDDIRRNWLRNHYKDMMKWPATQKDAVLVFDKQFKLAFGQCMKYQARAVQAARIAPSKSLSERLVDRMVKLFNIGEAAREDFHALASGTAGMSAQERENKLQQDMSQLCRRFGLVSFHIEGETGMSLRERERFVAESRSLLEKACKRLGIEDVSYGDEGKLQLYRARSIDGARGMMTPVLATDDSNLRPKIGLAQTAQLHTAIHEREHYKDFKLARIAADDDPKLLAQSMYFSEMPPEIQDRLPEAKKALKDLMGVHEDLNGITTNEAIKQFRQHMVKTILGGTGFMAASAQQMNDINDLLASHDDLFTKTIVEWHTRPEGAPDRMTKLVTDNQRLYAVIGLSCATPHDKSGLLDMVDFNKKFADILNISKAEYERKLMSALEKSTRQIQTVAGYVNPMARYVDRPSEMLRASGETLVNYPSRPAEVLARTTGRDSTLGEMIKNACAPKWAGAELSETKRAMLNDATATLNRVAGMKLREQGPKLGFPYEKLVAATVKSAVKAVRAVAKGYDVANTALVNAIDRTQEAWANRGTPAEAAGAHKNATAAKSPMTINPRLMEVLSTKQECGPDIGPHPKAS